MSKDATKQENFKTPARGRYAEQPHILVVDDDRRIRELVARYLGEQDFVVLSAGDAAEAAAVLAAFEVDAVVLDIMMPGQSGVEFTQSLRAGGQDVPVLLLTALGETGDRIKGLEAGADDYLPKPFEPRELVLRLQAIMKRTRKPVLAGGRFRMGPWVFDGAAQVLSHDDGREQRLTSAEVTLLQALAAQAGAVMSRDELAAACGVNAGERTIDVQVTRLRRKIEADTKNPRYLQTLRGKGYLLRGEEV